MPHVDRPPKWHHYVPQGYLRNFTVPEGWLYGYNKRTGRAFTHAKPRSVAAENDFHTDPTREDPQKLERQLAQDFESPLLKTINAVIAHVRRARADSCSAQPTLFPEEQRELAAFAALQLIRTKKSRNTMAVLAARQRTSDITVTDQTLARYAHLGLIRTQLQDEFRWFGDVIARHHLMFLVSPPESSFWTSDHPVLVGRGTEDGRAFRGGVGLNDENLELYLPLAWDVTAVFFGKHLENVPPVFTMTADQVKDRNRVTFEEADQLVLGRSSITPA